METGFGSYVDNNMSYATFLNICNIIKSFENDSEKLLRWFLGNQQK